MIGRLHGQLCARQPPALLIDVNGVGYEVEAPMSVFDELPPLGETLTLSTHLSIRDDAHVLYGFINEREREIFRSLIRVSGVGPKLALTLLSGMRAEEFARCVERRDTATLTRLPGVGRKTADRLIMELQDRLGGPTPAATTAEGANGATPRADDPMAEAISALVALGYKPAEANRLIEGLDQSGETSATLIRHALRKAVR